MDVPVQQGGSVSRELRILWAPAGPDTWDMLPPMKSFSGVRGCGWLEWQGKWIEGLVIGSGDH